MTPTAEQIAKAIAKTIEGTDADWQRYGPQAHAALQAHSRKAKVRERSCFNCNRFVALSARCEKWDQVVPAKHRGDGCDFFDDAFVDDDIPF